MTFDVSRYLEDIWVNLVDKIVGKLNTIAEHQYDELYEINNFINQFCVEEEEIIEIKKYDAKNRSSIAIFNYHMEISYIL